MQPVLIQDHVRRLLAATRQRFHQRLKAFRRFTGAQPCIHLAHERALLQDLLVLSRAPQPIGLQGVDDGARCGAGVLLEQLGQGLVRRGWVDATGEPEVAVGKVFVDGVSGILASGNGFCCCVLGTLESLNVKIVHHAHLVACDGVIAVRSGRREVRHLPFAYYVQLLVDGSVVGTDVSVSLSVNGSLKADCGSARDLFVVKGSLNLGLQLLACPVVALGQGQLLSEVEDFLGLSWRRVRGVELRPICVDGRQASTSNVRILDGQCSPLLCIKERSTQGSILLGTCTYVVVLPLRVNLGKLRQLGFVLD